MYYEGYFVTICNYYAFYRMLKWLYSFLRAESVNAHKPLGILLGQRQNPGWRRTLFGGLR